MPDTYEIEGPGGVFEIESNHPPTPPEIMKAVRAYGDSIAAKEQTRLQGGDQGSATGRFLSNAGEVLNPVTMAKGVYHLVRHPIQTGTALIGQQVEQGRQAIDLAKQGRYSEALGHGVAAALPILGPMAAEAGEQIGQGDVAGGLGKTAGMLAPFAATEALAARAAGRAPKAAILEREATQQVAGRVLAPGNPAYRARAQNIAPEILARKLSGGRLEIQEAAQAGMADAAARIDDGIQAAGGISAPIPVQDVIARLQTRIKDLQDSTGQPLSATASSRIKGLNDRILQLRSTGRSQGTATFEDLRKIRDENYSLADQARGYEKQGNPVMADEGWVAREVGSAIRQTFADRSPATAAANADFTFYKTLDDILDPAVGRPKQTGPPEGVTGGARTSGAVAGAMIGPKAAFVMSVVIPWLKKRASDPAWLLADANAKIKLAAALRKGEIGTAQTLMGQWAKYGPKQTTSPSGLQTQPAGATP